MWKIATNLFELYATLSISTDDFNQKVNDALAKGTELSNALDDLGNPIIAPGVDENGNVFAAILDGADVALSTVNDAKTAVKEADEALDGLDEKSSTVGSILQGLNEATGDVVEALIDGLVEYGAQAMEKAAATGSEIAKQYNAAKSSFDLSYDLLQIKAGEGLLQISTALYQALEALMGISQQEKAAAVLEQIDSYAFDKIEAAKQNFESIFGMFEKVEMPEETQSFTDMAQAQRSQLDYWKEYNETVAEWEKRFGGHQDAMQLFADLNDGSTESLAKMQSFLAVSDQEIAAYLDLYGKAAAERDAAAQKSAEVGLLFDENVQQMSDTFNTLITGLDQSAAAEANTSATGAAAVAGLAAHYDSFSSMIDAYNTKLAQLAAYENYKGGHVIKDGMGVPIGYEYADGDIDFYYPKATGLDYVPYNEYPALLHEGEAVLTKAEATQWRRGDGGGSVDTYALAAAVSEAVAAALNGASVRMNGQVVGNLVTGTVNRNIDQMAWEERFA